MQTIFNGDALECWTDFLKSPGGNRRKQAVDAKFGEDWKKQANEQDWVPYYYTAIERFLHANEASEVKLLRLQAAEANNRKGNDLTKAHFDKRIIECATRIINNPLVRPHERYAAHMMLGDMHITGEGLKTANLLEAVKHYQAAEDSRNTPGSSQFLQEFKQTREREYWEVFSANPFIKKSR